MDQLRTLLESVHYRLLTSDGQTLAEAGLGAVLARENSVTLDLRKELAEIQPIRSLLGLPLKSRGNRSPESTPPADPVSLRETMERQGVEHSTQRNKRTRAERTARKKPG